MIRLDLILAIIEIVLAVALFFLADYFEKMKNTKWRIAYLVPLFAAALMCGAAGFDICMLGVYLGGVILLIGFFRESVRLRKIVSILAAVSVVISVPVCNLSKAYRSVDYVEDFKEGFELMKERYVLSEHKDIDWDALYDEYLPLFREANNEQDDVANYIAWMSFTAEFHDGHIGYSPSDKETYEKAVEQLLGNDYGLSLVTLTDGRTVAVNVEPDSAVTAAGITDGTVITAWDGMSIDEAADSSVAYEIAIPMAVQENQQFYKAIYAAGVGGDTVTVSFIAEDGSEKQAVLDSLGSYYERFEETVSDINRGVDAGNLRWAEVSSDAVCLRIKAMMSTTKEEAEGAYDPMKNGIRAKIEEYEAAGYDKLVIDLRENGGGSGLMVKAIAELFSPAGEHYYCTDALWDEKNGCYATDENGSYIKGKDNYYTGEDIWDGRQIVLLVNAYSASAADHLSTVLGKFDNITVMGFTPSNGSAQGVNGVHLNAGTLQFSSALLLNENGDIFIDAAADRISRNPLELTIPFDEAAMTAIFINDEDYVLNVALQELRVRS